MSNFCALFKHLCLHWSPEIKFQRYFWYITYLTPLRNSDPNVDIMNEPHDIPAATVFNLVCQISLVTAWWNCDGSLNQMQAAVNGIRSSGATTQLILVEGTSWTGAWSKLVHPSFLRQLKSVVAFAIAWTSSGNSAAFGAIKDPNNNIAIGEHI